MAKTFREKTGIVALLLLIVLITVCSCAYMRTAKTWTVAASYVDDTMGSMDGYTVILYPGTIDPPSDLSLTPEGVSRISPVGDLVEGDDPLYVSDARLDYESKGARVLSLNTLHLFRYLDPSLLLAEGKRIGVFSVSSPTSQIRLNIIKEYFTQCNADVVVCLTPRYDFLESTSGVDILIVTTDDEGFSTIGIERDGTFIVRAPETNSVGAILITSNNVVSSKVLDEL